MWSSPRALARFPGTSAARQEAALTATATDLGAGGPDQRFGHGRVDVAAAATWLERAPDVTLVPARWTLGARAGGRVATHVDVRALHGFAGRVTLTARAGLAGARVQMPGSVRPGARRAVRLEVAIPSGARAGRYPLTISARSGSLSRSLTLGLLVRGAPHRRGSP